MSDAQLKALADELAAATAERDQAQAVVNAAQSRVRELTTKVRAHLKDNYKVDAWRL